MILSLVFTILSGGVAVLTCAVCPVWSWWWLLPLFIGGYVAAVLVYFLLLFSGLALLPRRDPSPRLRRITHRFVRLTLSWATRLLGYRIRSVGAEKLPDTPFLLVGNHRSAFDPICTVPVIHRDMVFVAKPGVMKIPVIGFMMKQAGFMAIDRDNARNAVTTIKLAAHRIAEVGLSVGIYPEGTRSKDEQLLPFHAGSFKVASMARCPVVVTSIRYEKGPLWIRRVHLHILDVMDADYVAANSTAAMADRAKEAIAADLNL